MLDNTTRNSYGSTRSESETGVPQGLQIHESSEGEI